MNFSLVNTSPKFRRLDAICLRRVSLSPSLKSLMSRNVPKPKPRGWTCDVMKTHLGRWSGDADMSRRCRSIRECWDWLIFRTSNHCLRRASSFPSWRGMNSVDSIKENVVLKSTSKFTCLAWQGPILVSLPFQSLWYLVGINSYLTLLEYCAWNHDR